MAFADSEQSTAFSEAAPAQVDEWLRAGEAVVIDVREPDEHAPEHIQGSRLLPLSRFEAAQAAALAKPGQAVVFHCRSGKRSADACRLSAAVASSGHRVYNLTGGIEGWKAAGLSVKADTRVTGVSVMRQVQMAIGAMVLIGSALTWFVHPGFILIPAFFGAGLTFAGVSGTCAMATLIGKLPWNRGCGASCGV